MRFRPPSLIATLLLNTLLIVFQGMAALNYLFPYHASVARRTERSHASDATFSLLVDGRLLTASIHCFGEYVPDSVCNNRPNEYRRLLCSLLALGGLSRDSDVASHYLLLPLFQEMPACYTPKGWGESDMGHSCAL